MGRVRYFWSRLCGFSGKIKRKVSDRLLKLILSSPEFVKLFAPTKMDCIPSLFGLIRP